MEARTKWLIAGKYIALVLVVAMVFFSIVHMVKGVEKDIHAQYADKHVFCAKCCWKNTFDGTTFYTCADSEYELWRRTH